MQTGAPIENVSVYRPPSFRFAPSYSVEMTESAVQIFDQVTDALHADESRMSFSIKSPGVGVICSPQMFLQMDWEIKCPGALDYRQAIGPIYQPYDVRDLDDAEQKEQADGSHALGYTPKIAFGEGDCVFNQLSSYNLVVNGASVSNHSQNLYKRSLDKCWIPDSVWKARYSQAGGSYQKYDSVAVSGEAYSGASFGGGTAYGADPKVVAFTADSGVQSRVEGLLGCITAVKPVDGQTDVYVVTVRAPLSGVGIFNPLTPEDECASSCPLQRSLYALAHMNNIQVDLLFEKLKQGIFRNLTSRNAGGNNDVANANVQGGFKCRMMGSGAGETAPQLHSRWIRLSSYRSIPDVITCSTYRNTVHRGSQIKFGAGIGLNDREIDQAILEGSQSVSNRLPPVGVGRRTKARCAKFDDTKYLECKWKAIQMAQAPSYLFFTMQKDDRILCLEEDGVAKQISDYDALTAAVPVDANNVRDGQSSGLRANFYARNTQSSAAIVNFSLEIQSSVGAYTYASDSKYPYIKTRAQLWKDHLKNTCQGYCDSEMQKWFKNDCCLLLHACDWLRGLTTTNTAFPIQINATCRFENRREFIDGAAASTEAGLTPVLHDVPFGGEPVMVALYPNTSLTITASSAAASAANFSHSAGLDLLSRKV